VSCPDWRGLAAHRERGGAGAASWTEAMGHFDACALCRREALAADPLLVFRRLPAVELTPAEESSEVEAMRQAVAAMRTGKRIESRRSFAGWRRWAAAAVLAMASLAMGRDRTPSMEQAAAVTPAPMPAAEVSAVPALEELNLPQARVYQWNSKELRVHMIFDPSIDV
jgi:hypothetical protein